MGMNVNVQFIFTHTKVFMKMMTIRMVVKMDMLRSFMCMIMSMSGDIREKDTNGQQGKGQDCRP